MASVGQSVPRADGRAKASGAALYVDDVSFPGMLYGRTIRSPHAHARILSRRHSLGSDFTVVDHRDIPGTNVVSLIVDDQPCLADDVVRHVAEPVMLIAHEDREALHLAEVEIEYEPLDPLLDPAKSETVFRSINVVRGDAAAAMAGADVVVEGEYSTGHQEQLYIEPNGVIAVPENGGITVYGSLQCPYYMHRALKVLLNLPDDKVRIVYMETGGGFGGKEEYPSMLAGHAALLALKSGRPVKMVYDRVEDMWATTKRHPFQMRYRTGVMRDGRIVAAEVELLVDGGAYTTLTPVVLSRGLLHAVGPYRCENVRVFGKAVMTNTPPNGAFRGFGAPQSLFAAEVHMERVADALGMDSVELREMNALRPGDATITGGKIGPDGSALQVLQEALRRSDYKRKREAYRGTDRGIGLALYFHGSGFTGEGEAKLASVASLEATAEGVRILSGTVEIGQGTRTIHAQIVAETLGIPFENVSVAEPDTAVVPDSGPTVASRTTMVVGGILQRCAARMLDLLDRRIRGQRHDRHDHARRADAALRTALLGERVLQRMLRAEPLDGRDVGAFRMRDRNNARAHRLSIDQHRACAAFPFTASFLRSRQPNILAQHVQQPLERMHVDIDALAINRQMHAAITVSGVAGRVVTSIPRWRIALTSAGAGPSIGSSPTPFAPNGPCAYGFSRMIVSMRGVSSVVGIM